MSKKEYQERVKSLGAEFAKGIKTESDLNTFAADLLKAAVEASLGAEMEEHLGYRPHSTDGHHSGNSRNGYSKKTLKSKHGAVPIETPRDRNGTFEPQLIGKGQTRLTEFDDQILYLYAKGLSTREIVDSFQELYGASVSASLISKVTEAVNDRVIEWQSRPLDPLYPIVYLDCIMVKVRQDRQVISKAVYVALGVNIEGHKDLLGLWIAETEGAALWLSVLTDLQNRGVQDIFIACVDGLKGFAEAIETAFPAAKVQLCIVHMVRNSMKLVPWKDRRNVARDLRKVYQAPTAVAAELALKDFAEQWDERYCLISQQWRHHWHNLTAIYDYPQDIRRAIYTTNAVESLNSVIRKAIRKRKVFPNDQAAMKVVFLATQQAAKKWSMPIRNWHAALNRFIIQFGDRITKHL